MIQRTDDKKQHALDLSRVGKGSRVTLSLGGIAAIIVGLFFGHGLLAGHLGNYLLTTAAAADLTDQIADASRAAENAAKAADSAADIASQTSMQLLAYMRTQELKEQRQILSTLEDQLQETLLWESENGENQISRDRKTDLRLRIDTRNAYIECLEINGPDGDCEL